MSQTFLSPGVETVEVDQSFIQAGVPQPGAILIGRTPAGRAFYPTTVQNFQQFTAMFGNLNPLYQLPYAANNYLKNASSLTVVRVLGHADGTSTTNGYTVNSVVGISDTSGAIGATGSILAVLHTNMALSGVLIAGVLGDANRFTVKIGSFAATASFLTSSDDYIGKSADFEVLKARLRAQLRRKHFEDENRRIREELMKRTAEFEQKFPDEVPRPPYWTGFAVKPESIEFWHEQEYRLHDRIVFRPNTAGEWTRQRLYP